MPTQIQVQNTILSAQLKFANEVLSNGDSEAAGNINIDWWDLVQPYLNIKAAFREYETGDYDSLEMQSVLNCLNTYIGFNTDANVINPNYQPPGGTIVVIDQSGTISPEPYIPYSQFDPVTQQPDGGRIQLLMPGWAGYNPVLSLTSPAETALNLGVDYTLIPTGGIILNPTSQVLPNIYDGMSIRSTGYKKA